MFRYINDLFYIELHCIYLLYVDPRISLDRTEA